MPKAGADAVGKVYIYNNTTIELTVTLNGANLASKVPAGIPSQTEAFKFGVLAVDRVNAPSTDDPLFADTNQMNIRYSGYSLNFSVTVPRRPPFQLRDNMQMVVNSDGYVLAGNGVYIESSYKPKTLRVETRGASKSKKK